MNYKWFFFTIRNAVRKFGLWNHEILLNIFTQETQPRSVHFHILPLEIKKNQICKNELSSYGIIDYDLAYVYAEKYHEDHQADTDCWSADVIWRKIRKKLYKWN
jgi:hypothetical protein